MNVTTTPPRSTVLVIDDEPNNCHIVNEILEGQYAVCSAASGEEGLQRVAEYKPDLIILDLLMPDMDGYEVCRRLKKAPLSADIPVLVVSALGQAEDKLLAYQVGADDYMVKPFNNRLLRAKIQVLLQRRQIQKMQLQQLLDLMPHGISVRDASGTLLLVNQHFCDFYGQPPSALIGIPISEVIKSSAHIDRIREQNRRVLLEQQGLSIVEDQLTDARGQTHCMHISKTRYNHGDQQAILTVATDISAQKKAELALRDKHQQLQEAEQLAGIGSWEWDILADRFTWSDNLYRMLGVTPEQLPLLNWETTKRFFLAEELEPILTGLDAVINEQGRYDQEHSMVCDDASLICVHAKAVVIEDADGRPVRMRGTVQDISARRQQQALQRLTALMFEQMADMVIITDPGSRIIEVNAAFTRITGYSREEAIGQTPALLRSHHHPPAFYNAFWQLLNQQGRWQGEIWNRRKSGDLYPSWLNVCALTDPQGKLSHYVGISRDLSEQKQAEQRLYYLTNYDIQTGLPNRSLLFRELEDALEQVTKTGDKLALIKVRINDFNLINESLGHLQGDAYIGEVATRLLAIVPDQKGVGRIDSNTLGIILPDLASPEALLPFLQQILAMDQDVVRLQDQDAPVSLNIGLSVFPSDALHAQGLMEKAVIALDQGQQRGRGHFEYYAAGMNNQAHGRLQIQADLRKALENNEFYLQYQPKVDFNKGQIIGAEALVRWQHPQRGFIPPSDFIPVAEDCDLIRELGAWVLKEACRQARIWRVSGVLNGSMAVNLSTLQLQDPSLVAFITELLVTEQLPAQALELEITESVLMQNPEQAVDILQRLRKLGIGLSLDDFGTGHSSLHYLSRLPVDKLKIDRSFVQQFEHHAEDALIINTIISMARGLGLKTVAEGVETASQCAYLQKQQCDELQGYYFSKPLRAIDFEHFVADDPRLNESVLQDHQQRTLLLIDDDPHILSSIKRLLRREGYQLLLAQTGQEAKTLLAQHAIQVVVCDQRMPDLNGVDFFHELKQTHPQIVRMMLGGHIDATAMNQAIHQGEIYKYITKPWDDAELIETLSSAFDKYDIGNG